MKKLTLSQVLLASLAVAALAEGTKLEGTATCAKCDLSIADKCLAAVVVKTADGKKETYLAAPSAKAEALQAEVCGGGKPASVEGTVTEKDGKKLIDIASYKLK